jgi:hypothetical protein
MLASAQVWRYEGRAEVPCPGEAGQRDVSPWLSEVTARGALGSAAIVPHRI